jgi:MoxR-like ATPase
MNMSTSLILKFKVIETYLNSCFVEREEVAKGALCALLSGSDLVLLGPPGTAKSAITRSLCSVVGGATYFEWLMTKFSTPEELFGPLSMKGLENDQYKRITTGKLPEANIAFVDEIFKSNSAILNALLTVMNERLFHNNGSPVKVPLISMFGASNELPESDELSALYDRFMLRFVVGYISEDAALEKMLKSSISTNAPVLTLQELILAQAACKSIKVPDEMIAALITIRKALKKEGIYPSDRRLKKTIPIMQAHAWLRGATKIEMVDMVFLQHCFWENPADAKTVKKTLKTGKQLITMQRSQ